MNDATDGQTNDSAPWPSEHTEAEGGQEWIMNLSREVIRRGFYNRGQFESTEANPFQA